MHIRSRWNSPRPTHRRVGRSRERDWPAGCGRRRRWGRGLADRNRDVGAGHRGGEWTTDRAVETRVSTAPVESFLSHNAGEFDLVVIGASTDRSNASRFVSPPTFERVADLNADVVIVDRP